MAKQNNNPVNEPVRMSGAGHAFGTDPLDLNDLTPKKPELPKMSPQLANYLANNGMSSALPPEYKSNSQSVKDMLLDVQANGIGAMQDPFKVGKQVMFDGRNPNLPNQFYERYTSHDAYDKLGFTPFRDNETLFNENSSAWDDLKRAAGQWTTLAGLGFKDAAGFGDLTDTVTAAKYERAMAIGSSTRGGVAGFANNLFLNSGYTIGIMGELLAEEVGMITAEALLGIGTVGSGGMAAGATVPAMAVTAGAMGTRAARAFGKIGDAWKLAGNLGKTLDSFKDINKAREYFTKGVDNIKDFLNPLENTTDFFKNTDKLYDIKKTAKTGEFTELSNLKKTAKGFGEFYKDVRNVRLAYGESSLEGGMVQNQMERDLLAEFKAENGRPPNDQEAAKIRATAHDAGVKTTALNMPLILMSNKLSFPGLTGGAMKRLGADVLTTNMGRKMIFSPKAALKEGGEAFTALPKNYFKAKWMQIKNPRLFATNLAKYSQANIMEGIQELGQETIASASEEYYKAQYSGDPTRGGYMDYVLKNLGGGHGIGAAAETFLSGFLMGGMTAPISTGLSAAMRGRKGFEGTVAGNLGDKVYEQGLRMRYGSDSEQYTKYKAQQKEIDIKREDDLNNDVNTLNELYKDPNLYFSPAMENILEQKEYRKMMQMAAQNNDDRTYYDMKETASIKHITTAMKYGHLDTMIERLADFKQMSPEETADVRGEMAHENFIKQVDKSIDHAKNISGMWEEAQRKYPNPFNPRMYAYNSANYEAAVIGKTAWDKAIEEMVFNQASFARTLARQKSILASAKDVTGLQNVAYTDINILFTQKDGLAELESLAKEVKAFEAAELVTPEAKRLYKEKKKKHDTLKEVLDGLRDVVVNSENEIIKKEDYAKVKKAYNRYIKALAAQSGDFVYADKLKQSLQQLLDYHLLTERAKGANDAVNILLDPSTFIKKFENIKQVHETLHENRLEEIRNSLKAFRDLKEKNAMLNELYDEGMFFDPKDLVALEEEGKIPDTFYYHEDGNVSEVYMTKDDYKKAVGILKKYLEAKGIDITNIDIAEQFNPYSAKSRAKSPNDTRTYKDYAAQFGFDPNADSSEVPLKQVLQAIIDSEHATPREAALAEKMLEIVDDKEVVTFSKGEKSPGLYSSTRGVVIDARYNSHEYKQGRNGHPIEHVILHEEVHRRTVDSLNTDQEFKDNMQVLFDEALEAWNKMGPVEKMELSGSDPTKALYGLSNLEEFVAEAMSNDTFQQFLGTVKTKTQTEKSTWVKFVDLVMAQLEKILGKRPNGTVLNAALELVTAKIDKTFGKAMDADAPSSTGTLGAGAVTTKMSIAELKGQHPELAAELVDIYIADQQKRKANGDDHWEGFDKISKDKIIDTPQFKNFFSLPNSKKDVAIYKYNKTITPEKKAEPKQTKSTADDKKAEIKRLESLNLLDKESTDYFKNGISQGIADIENEYLERLLNLEYLSKPLVLKGISQKEYDEQVDSIIKSYKSKIENVGKRRYRINLENTRDKELVNLKRKYDAELAALEQETKTSENELTTDEYNDFVNNGVVKPSRITNIAEKIKNGIELSSQEKEIFQDKTSEINEELRKISEKETIKTKPVEVKTEPFTPFKIKNDQLKSMVKALGYTNAEWNRMTLAEANKIAREGISKADRQAAIEAAKQQPDPQIEARRKELTEFVDNIVDGITDYESWEAAKAQLFAEVSSNPDYRKIAGITGIVIEEKLNQKLNELAFSVNFADIKLGEVLVINNQYQTKAVVLSKDANGITVEYLSKGSQIVTIKKGQVEEKIKYRYSEALEKVELSDLPQATPAELEHAKETVNNLIGLEDIEEDIKAAQEQTAEERDKDLLDSICKK